MRFTKDCDGIFEDKRQKERTGHLTEKGGKQEAPTKDTSVAHQSTRVYILKRTWQL